MKRYTDEEIKWLTENYTKLSSTECAKYLGRTSSAIRCFVGTVGITNTKEEAKIKRLLYNQKSAGEFNVNERLFINDINPITAYLLGLLWADGYLKSKKRFITDAYNISLSLQEKDGKYIKPFIETTGIWSFYIRPEKKHKDGWNKHKQYYWCCTNTILGRFLEDNDYKIKSGASPDKILSKISDELKHYFFLGYLDGDGCIFSKGKKIIISFCSVYDQDWTFLESLCKNLECKYSIRRVIRKNKNSKYSDFSIKGSKNCFKFSRFLYKINNNIGFPRKKERFLEIKKYIKRMIANGRYQWKNPDEIYKECLCE